jgi:hypothetical protein
LEWHGNSHSNRPIFRPPGTASGFFWAGVVAGFSFEVVEGLPDNAVGEAMVGYVATGERQTGDEK